MPKIESDISLSDDWKVATITVKFEDFDLALKFKGMIDSAICMLKRRED